MKNFLKNNSKLFLYIILGVFFAHIYNIIVLDTDVQSIENMETKKAFFYLKQKNALFIDARDFRFYKRKRIKGAISLPFSEKEEWRNILNDVSSERILITYCDSKICSLGRNLANYLKKHGFENVFTLEGGIDLWEERGLPIEQSDI